jgi:ketosteroid isomerase-like protein
VSQADLDVVLDQFAAADERDFARAMDHYADDVVLLVQEGFLNAGRFDGKAAVGEWFGDWFRAFGTDFRFQITEAEELGKGLVYLYASYAATGRVSGVEVSNATAYLYRVEAGKVKRVQLFPTREAAREAALLPQWSGAETD